jgi:hypothetical protein
MIKEWSEEREAEDKLARETRAWRMGRRLKKCCRDESANVLE